MTLPNPRHFSLTTLITFMTIYAVANTQATERIISTDNFATELIVSLGQSENLIAIDVTSKLPAGLGSLPNIGYHRNLSAEGLLSLLPTLVIGSEHIGPPNVVRALKAANIPLVSLRSAQTPEQLGSNISTVAAALRQTDKGDAMRQRLTERLTRLNERLPKKMSDQRVAFLLSMSPGKLRLAGNGTNGDAFINLLGATNIGTFENYQNVSAESLLSMEPSIILVAGKSHQSAVEELLFAQPILKFSSAAKTDAVLSVDGSSLVAGLSLSAIDEALRIANKLPTSAAK